MRDSDGRLLAAKGLDALFFVLVFIFVVISDRSKKRRWIRRERWEAKMGKERKKRARSHRLQALDAIGAKRRRLIAAGASSAAAAAKRKRHRPVALPSLSASFFARIERKGDSWRR